MDIVIFPQHWSALLCILIMIAALVIGIIKKYLMTYVLIISNFIIFVITMIYTTEIIYGFNTDTQTFVGLGFRSIYLSAEFFPQIYTLFTSMFIHGGFLHIIGNMLVFFFMGMPFEQRVGWKKFLIIYFTAGMCGALTHAVVNLNSSVPLIGASGAIFGIMGAFAYAYPRDEVIMPIGIGIMFLTRIKVVYAVLFWAGITTFFVWLDVSDGTAHLAHLGGLISGFLIAAIVLKKNKRRDYDNFETVKYDSYAPTKISKKDFSNLKKLATTPELKDMIKRIENETVSQVRDVWLEHFIDKAVCPKCKKPLHHLEGKVWCEYCGFRTNY